MCKVSIDVRQKRFLIVKLNHLGDTLLLTPSLRYLRERFPGARVDVVVRKGCEAVLEGNPDIFRVLTVAPPSKERAAGGGGGFFSVLRQVWSAGYDYAFDLSNSDRAKLLVLASRAANRGINDSYCELGWKRRIFNRFSHFEWGRQHQVLRDFQTIVDVLDSSAEEPVSATECPPLYIDCAVAPACLSSAVPGLNLDAPFVVIHPVSRWQFKQWLPERWAQVADFLFKQEGLQVVFSCGPIPDEQCYIDTILNACQHQHFATGGKLRLRELAALMRNADLFLGVDTVAMHLAAAVQLPSVVLFGPSSEWSWHPWRNRHQMLLGECSCKKNRHFVCDKSRVYPCMAGIETNVVVNAARSLLHGE